VSSLGSGTRTLAVYEERWAPQALGPLCVYLHRVSDPGNVGTILRSAEAFGASCVAFGPGSADPFSPKAVRASMGAIFNVAVAKVDGIDQLPGTKIALVAGAGAELWRIRSGSRTEIAELQPQSLLIGSEREGLPADLIAAADLTAHIPIQT